MKFLIRNLVRRRLGPFEQLVNVVDQRRPMNLPGTKRVAVIGGGLAGATAAVILSERGFKVEVFEREAFLGGKVGSWKATLETTEPPRATEARSIRSPGKVPRIMPT